MSLSACRFDLMAKYLYIKFKEKNINSDFFKELYHKHLITFNNCFEFPDKSLPNQKEKKNIDDFINSFDELIDSIKTNGFNENYPITIGTNNIIVNGAHRLAISYFYNINPKLKLLNEPGNVDYNYKFFIYRRVNPPLDSIYADTMALEYIKQNPKIRAIILYPVAYPYHLKEVLKIINEYGYIYYHKSINLTHKGVNNLIKELYRGEQWIGGLFPPGFSPGGKAQRCIHKENYSTILLLVEMNDVNKCVELKERCRDIYKLGKHSLHISDYTEDTFRIGASLLNENSVYFLNHGTNDISENTKKLLKQYFDNADEDYCLTSSLIMEMYGLRQAKDIDYLQKDNIILNLKDIGIHDGIWEKYYHKHKDEIIYDPRNYFYFNGFKFATLDIIKKMKERRNEKKDITDLQCLSILL